MHDPDGKLPGGFPLGVASNGQYCKKFRRKRYHFGSILAGWKAALKRFQHDWPFVLAGRVPPPMADGERCMLTSLDYIANEFVRYQLARTRRDELSAGCYIEIRNTIDIVLTHWGQERDARTLLPVDFSDLRHALKQKWTRSPNTRRWSIQPDRPIGPDLLKRRIIHVRAMFNHARANRLIPDLPLYGKEFKIVPIADIRRARRNRAREHGVKLFPVEQIKPIYDACDGQLQAAFLLSILCGFNEADCGFLPQKSLDLKNGFIDFDRVKTGVYRRVALPPVLVDALKTALASRPEPKDPEAIVHREPGSPPVKAKELLFITPEGNPWVTYRVKEIDGQPDKINHHGGFGKRLVEVLISLDLKCPDGLGGLKFKRKGISFGAGRHTFESHAKRVGDDNIVDFIMGHTSSGMDKWYDHPPDADLRSVATAVYLRLFHPDQPFEAAASATTPMLRLAS